MHGTLVTPVNEIVAPQREPNPKRDEWRSEQDLEAQWAMANWAKVAAIAAFFGVFATALGIYFVKQTLEATRAAVAQTTKAADAAHASVKVASETAEKQLRAYVLNGSVILSNFVEGNYAQAAIKVKNFGQTPAYDMMVTAIFDIAQNTPNVKFQVEPDEDGTRGPLGAGAEITMYIKSANPLQAGHIEMIKNRGYAIIVYGVISYRDIFDHKRLSRFQVMYGPREIERGDGKMGTCPEGNEAA